MGFALPDGSKVFISTGFGAAATMSALSNANPAVATATAHGYSNGDELLAQSGWDDIQDNIYRAANVAANTLQLSGADTSDTNWFPAGTGTGTLSKVTGWQEISQITGISASGGDAQFATVDLLGRRNAINIPARFNPTTLTITLADDVTLAGYQALVAATRTLAKRALKFVLAGGTTGYGYGYVALNEMPQLNKGQINTVQASISLLGRFIRY